MPIVKHIEPPQEPEPKVSAWAVTRAFYDSLLDGFSAGDYGQIDFEGEQPATIKQGLKAAAARRNLKLQFMHKRGRAVFRLFNATEGQPQ